MDNLEEIMNETKDLVNTENSYRSSLTDYRAYRLNALAASIVALLKDTDFKDEKNQALKNKLSFNSSGYIELDGFQVYKVSDEGLWGDYIKIYEKVRATLLEQSDLIDCGIDYGDNDIYFSAFYDEYEGETSLICGAKESVLDRIDSHTGVLVETEELYNEIIYLITYNGIYHDKYSVFKPKLDIDSGTVYIEDESEVVLIRELYSLKEELRQVMKEEGFTNENLSLKNRYLLDLVKELIDKYIDECSSGMIDYQDPSVYLIYFPELKEFKTTY